MKESLVDILEGAFDVVIDIIVTCVVGAIFFGLLLGVLYVVSAWLV